MQTVSFCFPKICFLDWNNWCKDRRIIGAGIGGRGKETQMTQPGQKRNYQREMEQIMEREGREGRIPSLLLHSCCAPCSSYVLEYLSPVNLLTNEKKHFIMPLMHLRDYS